MGYINKDCINNDSIIKIIVDDKELVDCNVKLIDESYLGISLPKKQRLEGINTIQLVLVEDSKLLKCKSNVLGSKISNFEQLFLISIPEIIMEIERRKFQRIPLVTTVEYSFLPDDTIYHSLIEVTPVHYRLLKKSFTVDISAGGISIIVPKTETVGKFVLLTLQIKFEKIITLCRTVRAVPTEDKINSNVAFEYIDIKPRQRQLILDFVNEKCK